MRKIPGIDFSSGSLGRGLSIATGMAPAARVQDRGYHTYCLLGDGEPLRGPDLGGCHGRLSLPPRTFSGGGWI